MSAASPDEKSLILYSPDQGSLTKCATKVAEDLTAGDGTESPPKRLLKYDYGYGDFCFLRLVDRYPKPPIGVVDEFVRKGTFPFMKLPPELRNKIYKLILAPLLAKEHLPGTGEAHHHLSLDIKHSSEWYYERKLCIVKHILECKSNKMDPKEKTIIEEERQKVAGILKNFPPKIRPLR